MFGRPLRAGFRAAALGGRGPIRAGDSSNLPSWAQSAVVGRWIQIPFSNTLHDIRPTGVSINPNYPSSPEWGAGSGQAAIVTAWCGACYDDESDVIWLPLQGGHADYAGNEPYKAGLMSDTPTWEMVRAPSGAVGNVLTTNDGQESSGVYSDGRPRAVHSYNKPVFVPGVGPCMSVQGNASWSAGGGSLCFLVVDPETGEGTSYAQLTGSAATYSSGGGATYDSLRHAVWWRGAHQSRFAKYDVAANTWTSYGSDMALTGATSLCYLPDHDCILWGNEGLAQDWAVFDCATQTVYQPTFSGTPAGGLRSGNTSPRWVASLGACIAWDNDTDRTLVTRLTVPADPLTDTWTIDTLSVDGGNAVTPSARATNGTYGRCMYSSNLGGLIVFNSTSGAVYFFKVE